MAEPAIQAPARADRGIGRRRGQSLVHRLRSRSICPTRLGPRQPGLTWRPTAELERRFGRRGRTSATLLPVLEVADGLSSNAIRGISERLGIRAEPSPSTFTADDALRLCVQLQGLFPGPIDASDLREVIKPVYRQLFELLSGHSSAVGVSLSEAPLLANTGQGLRFLPVTEVLYASTPGFRERSGVAGAVSTFVLEAEASATAPLRALFGIRFLEEALEWQPNPGEPSLDPVEIQAMRVGLRELVPTLLARIRTERSAPADARTFRAFIDKVEAVESLTLACSSTARRSPASLTGRTSCASERLLTICRPSSCGTARTAGRRPPSLRRASRWPWQTRSGSTSSRRSWPSSKAMPNSAAGCSISLAVRDCSPRSPMNSPTHRRTPTSRLLRRADCRGRRSQR